jgi:hypothetical protein
VSHGVDKRRRLDACVFRLRNPHPCPRAGLGSFFVGTSLQTSMPLFAHALGAGSAGTAYGVLPFANGAGGVIGGVLLEATGSIKPSGFTVGLLGAAVGIHASLGFSAAALCLGTLADGIYALRDRPGAAPGPVAADPAAHAVND